MGGLGVETGGVLGLIILILDVWAILKVIGSNASMGGKVIWTVAILILPIIGFVVWWFIGPKGTAASA